MGDVKWIVREIVLIVFLHFTLIPISIVWYFWWARFYIGLAHAYRSKMPCHEHVAGTKQRHKHALACGAHHIKSENDTLFFHKVPYLLAHSLSPPCFFSCNSRAICHIITITFNITLAVNLKRSVICLIVDVWILVALSVRYMYVWVQLGKLNYMWDR